MVNSLILPVGILLNVVPYAFLCYYPYRDNLKVPLKSLLIFCILLITAQFCFNYFFQPMPYLVEKVEFFVFLFIYFIIYFFTIKMNFSKKIFIFLITTNYAAVIIGISNFLEIHMFPHCRHFGGYSIELIILSIAIYAVSMPVDLYVTLKYLKPLLNLTNTKAWNSLWIIPLMFLLTFVSFSGADNDNLVKSWQYITVVLTMAIGGTVIYYAVFKMLLETDLNATLMANVRMTNIELNTQKYAYENLSKHISEIRAVRHDLRHHLSVIKMYLQAGDLENLNDYLSEFENSLPENRSLVLCKNTAVNSIALYYLEKAKAEGIEVSADLQVPKSIGISDSDLCICFGNCIENALEACRMMKDGKKYIYVKSKVRGEMLGIAIDNSFDGTVILDKGLILSKKRNHEEGIGLASVRAIASKYNGNAMFTYSGHNFQSSVLLNMQNDLMQG